MAITVTTNGSTSVTVTAPASSSVVVTEKGGSPTASNVAATGAVMKTATSTADFDFVIDEDNFSSNSATKVPTQQSVKALFDQATDLFAAEATARIVADSSLNTSISNLQSRLGSGTTSDALSDIGTPASDDKVLIQDTSDSNNLKYVDFGDFGSGVGDITGVTITTDSGGASKAEDTSGSADFSILGSNGVGVTNSGTTITATAVPGEIDHDSLNNFVAAEHVDWAGSSAGTIHSSNIPTLNQNTTGSAATLTTPRAINGVNFDGSGPITVTAAGSTLSDTVPVSKGGTGATSFADKSVIITQDSGTDTLAAVAMSTNGQILIGGTSGPAVSTLTAGSNVTITNADGAITIAASGGGSGGVTSIVAGSGIGLSPSNGLGDVTVSSTASFDYARAIMSASVLKDGGSAQDFDSATAQKVKFDTSADTEGTGITIDTSNNRITVGATGYYQLTANISFFSGGARTTPATTFKKNGSTDLLGEGYGYIRASNDQNDVNNLISCIVELQANDYVEVFVGDSSSVSSSCFATQAFFEVSSTGGATGPTGSQGPSGTTYDVVTLTGSTTLTSSHTTKYLVVDSASNVNLTVPATASYDANAEFVIEQRGAGAVTVVAASGVTVNTSETLVSGGQYAVMGLKRTASNVYTLTGERQAS